MSFSHYLKTAQIESEIDKIYRNLGCLKIATNRWAVSFQEDSINPEFISHLKIYIIIHFGYHTFQECSFNLITLQKEASL